MQKTSGTLLGRRLTWGGVQTRPCICLPGILRCRCPTEQGLTWLVSRYSTGWICGLHADLTEYSQCIDRKLKIFDSKAVKRKFLYFTVLRNPVERYLSEWLHVRRGATWHSSPLRCNGKSARSGWFRPCYTVPEFMSNVTSPAYLPTHQVWYKVSLQTFLLCPFNLANNRQTRMLANLTSLGCYSQLAQWLKPSRSPYQILSTAQRTLCLSAKYNLAGFFHTFGLSDHMVYTQYMLQRALRIVFNFPLTNLSSFIHGKRTHAQDAMHNVSATDLLRVYYANRLDAELYEFAERLFLLRFTARVVYDTQIHHRFRRPLYTLWIRNNWPALEYNLLLTKTLNTTSSFYFRFNRHLLRIFQRQSKPQ